MINQQLIACQECGQLHYYQDISVGNTAYCVRCSGVLYRHWAHMQDSVLALTITGLILFILSNIFPLLGLRAQRVDQELHLLGASIAFWQQEYPLLSLLLLFNTILFPLAELLSLLMVLLTVRYQWQARPAIWAFRWMRQLRPWGMLEVFMLGILVAIVKLGDIATLIIGTAFWSFAALIVVMAAANALLDPFTIWRSLERRLDDERVT